MIEVFQTDVIEDADARHLVVQLQQAFPDYLINFDLDDCDHILRIKCNQSRIDIGGVTKILSDAGFSARVLLEDATIGNSQVSYKRYQALLWCRSISK